MIKIEPSTLNLEMTRGDSGDLPIQYLINNESVLRYGDKVEFKLCKKLGDPILLTKTVEEFDETGKANIHFDVQDTLALEKGNYIYSLKVYRSDGNVDTLNPNRQFSSFTLKEGV